MLKKKYLKSRPVCKVTFSLPAEALHGVEEVRLLGDFNDWNWEAAPVMQRKELEYRATVELPVGQTFQFRYVADNGLWENDWAADGYVASPYHGTDNSVLELPPPQPAAAKAVKRKRSGEDDLTKLEGIGPKIAGILREAGFSSYDALAQSKANQLKAVLAEAGSRYRMHDPTTWPKQARLAAAGDWDKLKKWQKVLKGGRKKK